MTPVSRAVAAFLISVLLAACGGGALDGEAPTSPPTADSDLLLPYVTQDGKLKLLDPESPSTVPADADSGLTAASAGTYSNMFRVRTGTYNGATNDLSDVHYRYLVYIKAGRVYRLDLRKSVADLPNQVSNITDACALFSVTENFAQPLNSWLEVTRSGLDGQCNQKTFVRLSTGAASGGFTPGIPFRIAMVVRSTDGNSSAFLVEQGDASAPSLQIYSEALAAQGSPVALEPGTSVQTGPASSRTRGYFRMQLDTDTAEKLYRYDASAGSLTALHTFSAARHLILGVADDLYLYFADGHRLLRVAHGALAAEILHTPSASLTAQQVLRSTSRVLVVYANANTGGKGLYSFPQSPVTDPGQIITLESETTASLGIAAVAGARVYYTVGSAAVRVGESGTGRTSAAGQWGPDLDSTTFDVGGLTSNMRTRTIILVASDGTCTAIDAASGSQRLLGTAPAALGVFGGNFGRYLLLNLFFSVNDTDVYFADVDTAGSLRAIATTAGANESAPR